MPTFEFPSSSSDVVHRTTIYENGTIQCTCIAGRNGKSCWHLQAAREAMARERPIVSLKDRAQIQTLAEEGNEQGAQQLAHDLFPSMSVEETEALVAEIIFDDHA